LSYAAIEQRMIGRRFGRLVVLSRHPDNYPGGHAKWICKCECGEAVVVHTTGLKGLHVTDCGCSRRLQTRDERLARIRTTRKANGTSLQTESYRRQYRQRIRRKVIILLGGKCSNPNCRHMGEDGVLGCKDERLLHVDHPDGGGNIERKVFFKASHSFYKHILDAGGKGYRLLCAQCNWLHRFEDF
jgi:hypothetical protein